MGNEALVSLGKALSNSRYTIVRDARHRMNERIPQMGVNYFIEQYMQQLSPRTAEIPYPIDTVYFEVECDHLAQVTGIHFHVECRGDRSLFTHMGEYFVRINGVISYTQKTHDRILLSYRRQQFSDISVLHQLLNEDLESLRNFLTNVRSVFEEHEDLLREELRRMVKEIQPIIAPVVEITEQLEVLGYRRLPPIFDESAKRVES